MIGVSGRVTKFGVCRVDICFVHFRENQEYVGYFTDHLVSSFIIFFKKHFDYKSLGFTDITQ